MDPSIDEKSNLYPISQLPFGAIHRKLIQGVKGHYLPNDPTT